jgi:O-antigen chain-terminating methyltransferase
LDVGCGRGEWLELVQKAGLEGRGVDIDGGMLSACRERGLSVEQADGIALLEDLPSESLALVSAFHVVEHIPFAQLQKLVEEALRVLQPGGFLVLETPNPENLSVGAHTFYLDPSHERPIPPALLGFLPSYYGYERVTVWRLQEPEGLPGREEPALTDVLLGVSPDYAVIAQKSAKKELLDGFDFVFESEPGIGLRDLSQRHDQALKRRFESVDFRIGEVSERQEQASERQEQGLKALEQLESEMSASFQNLELRLQEYQQELLLIYKSRSWRITAPMRWVTLQARLLKQLGPKDRFKAALRRVAAPIIRYADVSTRKSLRLRHFLLSIARALGIHHKLVRFYQFTRLKQAAARHAASGYELSESQRKTQAGWLPPKRHLEVDELMARIRSEVDSQNRQQPESSRQQHG